MPNKFQPGQRVSTEYGLAVIGEVNEPGTHYFVVFDEPVMGETDEEPMIDSCLPEDRLEEVA